MMTEKELEEKISEIIEKNNFTDISDVCYSDEISNVISQYVYERLEPLLDEENIESHIYDTVYENIRYYTEKELERKVIVDVIEIVNRNLDDITTSIIDALTYSIHSSISDDIFQVEEYSVCLDNFVNDIIEIVLNDLDMHEIDHKVRDIFYRLYEDVLDQKDYEDNREEFLSFMKEISIEDEDIDTSNLKTVTLQFSCGCSLLLYEEEDGRYFCSYKHSKTCSKYHKYLMFELFPFYLRYSDDSYIVSRRRTTERYLDFFRKYVENITNEEFDTSEENRSKIISVPERFDEFFFKLVIEYTEKHMSSLDMYDDFENNFPEFHWRMVIKWKEISKIANLPELEDLYTAASLLFSNSEYLQCKNVVYDDRKLMFVVDNYYDSALRFIDEFLQSE